MILISLLGDDLSILNPVINEFKDTIIHHLIIHDDADDDVRRAKQFQKGLERFIQNHYLRWKSDSYQLDEDSKNDIVCLYHCKFHSHVSSHFTFMFPPVSQTCFHLFHSKFPLGNSA